jgi:monoamine oxidase
LVAGFGPDAKALDLEDHSQVEYAIHKLVPDVDVVQSAGHDWLADEFSRETWPMLGPNQLTTYLRELQRPDGRVVLAGSDYASGWAGFIDGAIESGIRASSAVQKLLGATR